MRMGSFSFFFLENFCFFMCNPNGLGGGRQTGGSKYWCWGLSQWKELWKQGLTVLSVQFSCTAAPWTVKLFLDFPWSPTKKNKIIQKDTKRKREVLCLWDCCFHGCVLSYKLMLCFEFDRNLKVIMLCLSPKFWILTEGLGQFFVKVSLTAMV